MRASMSLKAGLFSGGAFIALAMASAAPAQTAEAEGAAVGAGAAVQANEPSPGEAENGDDIVVTGTRVIRDGFEAPTPLTVLTQEDIQNSSPTNNIADFVNQLPSLAGSTRPANSRLNLSSGEAGINALNLRNLGSTRTLVLLNGRRSVASTISGVVDVNTIPQALVQRVEVVTGGASAAYGSDAVAGVVNFVLDNKYEGLKVTGDIGITDKGDGFNYSLGVAGGWSFAGGRGHLLLSGEVAHKDGIFEVDRDWNHTGYVRIPNPDYNATTNSSVPQFLIRRMVGAANSTPGGLITESRGATINSLCGTYFGQGGSINQYQYGALTFPSNVCSTTSLNTGPSLTQGGDWRVNDSGRRIGLDARDDRHGVFGRLSFEVADGVNLFAEASYNWQEVYFNAGPNLSTGQLLQATGCGTAATAADAPLTCNAFLYNTLGPAALEGVTGVVLATTAADLPFRVANNRREVQRYLIGAEGDFDAFGSEARWDIYGQYGRAKLHEQLRNIMHTPRLNASRDAVFAQAGNPGNYAVGSIQCLINVDASTTNDDPNCRPLNRLGIGVADPAAIDYVLGDPFRDETIEQTVVGANLSLTPFATWAGDVSVAVGGEYRKEKISGFVPQEFQPVRNPNGTTTNVWSVGNYLPSEGSYDVKEAYLETVVPLGLGLEFNGAVRGTDYSTSGFVTTWKLGATWQPIEDIRLRVTRSRDIRAPNLFELFAAGTANTDSVRNPFFVQGQQIPGPGNVVYGASIGYSGFITGNPDLEPEKADSWNVGAVVTPRFLPGFSASVDYFDIDLDDAIDSISAQEIINRCFEGLQEYCDAISPDPQSSTPRILIRRQPFNFANIQVRGIDFEAAYRRPLDTIFDGASGDFTLRGVATRYLENRVDTGIEGVVPVNTVGFNGGQFSTPKWLYRFNATYDTEGFSITGVARGVSSGKYVAGAIECETNCPVSTPQNPTYDDLDIEGAFYVDLNLTAKMGIREEGDAELFLNITNLFDADPILLPETGLAANSTYSDLLGRAFRIGFRVKTR